jgi:nitrite reductase/ring-hydroxylating ferredoxin subunit
MRNSDLEVNGGRTRGPSQKESCDGCGSCGMDRRGFVALGLGLVAAAWLPSELRAASIDSIRAAATSGVADELRYPTPSSDGVQVDRDNEVILVRQGTTIAAFALSCPHQRSMLRWREKDGIFQCTKHHSQYLPTGEFQKGRATRNMDRLAIRVEGDEVVVNAGTIYHSDEDASGWDDAVATAG